MSFISDTDLVFNVAVPANLGVGSSSSLGSAVNDCAMLYVYLRLIRIVSLRVMPVLVTHLFFFLFFF